MHLEIKKHHKLLIALTIIGVLFLLYLLIKRAGASGGGAVDTSNFPTIISTGGGLQFPQMQNGMPQQFDSTIPGQTNLYQQPSVTPSNLVNVMPGTSGSGVPAHTAQAQEFNTSTPYSTPSASASMPSYYTKASDLPAQAEMLKVAEVNPVLVAEPGFGAYSSPNLDLASFIRSELRGSEITTTGYAGDFKAGLLVGSNQYCDIHPEACTGADRLALVNNATEEYSSFLNAKRTLNNLTPVDYAGNPMSVAPAQNSAPITNTQPTTTPYAGYVAQPEPTNIPVNSTVRPRR